MKLNEKRAEWAQKAVDAYQQIVGGDDDDAIGDLITDLMHLADQRSIHVVDMVETSAMHFDAERRDDAGVEWTGGRV